MKLTSVLFNQTNVQQAHAHALVHRLRMPKFWVLLVLVASEQKVSTLVT